MRNQLDYSDAIHNRFRHPNWDLSDLTHSVYMVLITVETSLYLVALVRLIFVVPDHRPGEGIIGYWSPNSVQNIQARWVEVVVEEQVADINVLGFRCFSLPMLQKIELVAIELERLESKV